MNHRDQTSKHSIHREEHPSDSDYIASLLLAVHIEAHKTSKQMRSKHCEQ